MDDIPSTMLPTKLVDIFERADVASSSPSSASLRGLRIQKNQEHLRYLWICLGSIIGVLTVIRFVRFALERLAPCLGAKPLRMQDSEKSTGQTLRAPGIQRTCWALATGFRIVFFRWNIRLLPGFLLSFSEISFICGYIALNLALLFIDSELLLFITLSSASNFL